MVYMRNNYPDTPPTYDTTLTEDAVNTSYNGINALPDGTIVVKSLYRVAGCTTERAVGAPRLPRRPKRSGVQPDLGQPEDHADHRQHHAARIRGRPAHHHALPRR